VKVYVLRHGDAVPSWTNDSARALSELGRKQVQACADSNREALAQVQQVFVSPYIRAQQTCDIVRGEVLPEAETVDWLAPDAMLSVTVDKLRDRVKSDVVLLVSHQPLVSNLIEILSGANGGSVHMSTASLALLETNVIAARCADLVWIKPSE
jgi:phosphohistidine phosphatase SixA